MAFAGSMLAMWLFILLCHVFNDFCGTDTLKPMN